MQDTIQKRARELLESGSVKVIIGYGKGFNHKAHAIFVRKPEDTSRLIMGADCVQNLAVYVKKEEVVELGKAAVVANMETMRSLVQLFTEYQVTNDSLLVLGMMPDGSLKEFATIQELIELVSATPILLTPEDQKLLEKIQAMTLEERWDFWRKELEPCIKCYACRAACPMCYCIRCQVECNQPQWIHVPSHDLGNLEWHAMRAMHLAGRCIQCGACHRACPLGIPLHLLTINLAQVIEQSFGLKGGISYDDEYVLATFKPDDKENFIR